MAEELTRFEKALPANIEDLSTFVAVGREKWWPYRLNYGR